MIVKITREKSNLHETLGVLNVQSDKAETVFSCHTLELPWLLNERRVSCVPLGFYEVRKRFSLKYGSHLHLQNVSNRDMILIHAGNFFTQTNGCILVGRHVIDLNNDTVLDVTDSKRTLRQLLSVLPNQFYLSIESVSIQP